MATGDHRLTAGTAAFQFSGFRLYQIARFCIVFCTEMQSVAVGWQVYEITHRPLDLPATRPGAHGPGAISAGRRAVSSGGARGRPLRPEKFANALLRGICGLVRTA